MESLLGWFILLEVGIVSSQVRARTIFEDVTSIKPPITSKEIYSHHHHTVPLGIRRSLVGGLSRPHEIAKSEL